VAKRSKRITIKDGHLAEDDEALMMALARQAELREQEESEARTLRGQAIKRLWGVAKRFGLKNQAEIRRFVFRHLPHWEASGMPVEDFIKKVLLRDAGSMTHV